MHQPTWGAALLLHPQASPPPCSLSPQVASFQVCFKTTSALLPQFDCFGNSRPGLKLDEQSAALIQMKCLPLASAIQTLYPDMYR